MSYVRPVSALLVVCASLSPASPQERNAQPTDVLRMTSPAASRLPSDDDACSDVLRIGLHDVYRTAIGSTLKQSLFQWACSNETDFSKLDLSSGGSVLLPNFPAPIQGKLDIITRSIK